MVKSESRVRELVYSDLLGRRGNETTAREWGAIAAQFEQVCGYKEEYTREDLTLFLGHLRKRGLCLNTIYKYLKPLKLLAQVQGWNFPKLTMRRVTPGEVKRPILEKEDITTLITMGKYLLNPTELCYLALSTTYGLRRIEMVKLKASDITPDYLTVHTAKGGRKTTHLIPTEITPYLEAFKPYKEDSLTDMFHNILIKTGLTGKGGFGWHSVRRALATEMVLSEVSTLNVLRFMRWSDASARGEFGMLAIYAKKDQARIDQEIFEIHPFLPYWRN